jgi:TP901 family phage tail tape measure protein
MPNGVDAGSVYSEVRVRLSKLTGDIQAVNAEFDKMAGASQKTGEKIQNNFEGAGERGTKAMKGLSLEGVAAFALIAEGIKRSIESFSQFESSMQRNRAIMTGSTADFNKLEEAALKVGSSSDFSAKQAADALYIFSKSGMDAATSIKMLDTSQTLAKVSGSELTDVASMLKTTLKQFNLGVDQAERLSNVFAAAKLPLEDISATMRIIGPVASGMGIKIEEVTAIIKKLSAAGMEGGMAGSALRLVLGDIGDKSSALSKKLVEYGINLDKVNPQTHTFAQIIGELGNAGLTTTDIMTIFGGKAGGAMVTLLGQGQKALEDYTASITGTSEAARQAAIVDDTLEDRTKTMQNAFQAAGISIVKEISPALKGLTEIITKALNIFMGLPGPVKMFIGICAIGIPTVIGLNAALAVLGGLLTASAGPIAAVVIGLGAAVTIGVALASQLKDNSKEWKTQKEWIDQNTKSVEDYNAAIIIDPNKGKRGAKELREEIAATTKEIEDLKKAITDMEKGSGQPAQRKFTGFSSSPDNTAGQVDDTNKLIEAKNRVNLLISGQGRLYQELNEVEKQHGETSKRITEEQRKATEDSIKAAQNYQDKIEKVGMSEFATLELERKSAIAKVVASNAGIDAKQKEIDKINEYYNLLQDDRSFKEYKKNAEQAAKDSAQAFEQSRDTLISGIGNISSALSSLFSAVYEERLQQLDAQMIAEEKAAGVLQDTAVETAQKELDEAIKKGDKTVIAEKQTALKRTQIEAEYEKKKAKLAYEGQHAAWQMQLLSAVAGGALAVINAYSSASAIPIVGWVLGPIAAGIAAVAAGLQIAAVAVAEPKPPSFDTGGIYSGPSGGSATLEHGEMMLNQQQQAQLWDKLNGSGTQGGDININNQFGGIYSDLDYERYNRDMVRKVEAARRAR